MPDNENQIVKRVRILTYIGPLAWVRQCTESPNNYVTSTVEFRDKDGLLTRSITSKLLDMEVPTERELS